MTYDERIKAEAERIKLIKKWPARLRKLAARKTDPLSERQFCLRYALDIPAFNRKKNLVNIPRDISDIEAAFEKEKV